MLTHIRWVAAATALTAAAIVLGACTGGAAEPQHAHQPQAGGGFAGITRAIAVLHPTAGHTAHGVVRFVEEQGKVRVQARIEGLAPHGTHGFHIHEYGDCSAPDGTSAGGHYNPEGHPHAGPQAFPRHAGDLGNVVADEHGVATLELVLDNITIAGAKNPILGRGMIVHAQADDLKSQPTGAAGARIACGVIGIANPGER
ncbi:MAG: superoxide dismutase [Cu-Zn] [Planctomycetota bacterium]|nr:MAG: superoxide dismutase [Cu-Zn] [Planctomycetota bacterium]